VKWRLSTKSTVTIASSPFTAPLGSWPILFRQVLGRKLSLSIPDQDRPRPSGNRYR
jgi:hypothetical protein